MIVDRNKNNSLLESSEFIPMTWSLRYSIIHKKIKVLLTILNIIVESKNLNYKVFT